MRNFLQTVRRELEARIDTETNKIYYNDHVTSVNNLPLGIDTQGLAGLIEKKEKKHILQKLFSPHTSISPTEDLFKKYHVILGIDRLDYTKGLLLRLQALNMFFEKYPHYKEKVVYFGILAPSRQAILSYQKLEDDIILLADDINKKYQTKSWKPIELIFAVFTRQQVINFYTNASVCLVTPLDDGMNLVSKEFIVATSFAENPGMLVLSQFAGSAIDLTSAVIVNPYAVDQVADAIKQALDMPKKEKLQKIQQMKETLDEKNVFDWTRDFVKSTLSAGEDNK
jgi:trehalose 6-phosphate synthase/phosphatase